MHTNEIIQADWRPDTCSTRASIRTFKRHGLPEGETLTGQSHADKRGKGARRKSQRTPDPRVIWRKAELPEIQFRAMSPTSSDHDAYNSEPPAGRWGHPTAALKITCSMKTSGRWAGSNELLSRDVQKPKSHCCGCKPSTSAGPPTGREPYGDGVPIVVEGIPVTVNREIKTHPRRRQNRSQGEGGQVAPMPGLRGTRDA